MPYRLTKIYTRKGDLGYTSLRGQRLSKDDVLVEAIGDLDELNAHIGLIFATKPPPDIAECLTQIQNDLFDLGGELHAPEYISITADKITHLEQTLDNWNSNLPPLEEFLLPRGNLSVTATHIARTVCRRAERTLVKLHRHGPLANLEMIRYLNRLSDLLFVMARTLSQITDEPEVLWEHERK